MCNATYNPNSVHVERAYKTCISSKKNTLFSFAHNKRITSEIEHYTREHIFSITHSYPCNIDSFRTHLTN